MLALLALSIRHQVYATLESSLSESGEDKGRGERDPLENSWKVMAVNIILQNFPSIRIESFGSSLICL